MGIFTEVLVLLEELLVILVSLAELEVATEPKKAPRLTMSTMNTIRIVLFNSSKKYPLQYN